MYKIKSYILIVTLIIVYCGVGQLTGQTSPSQHDPLYYNVEVNAQVVPIYAVDSKGNPVYDLREDEIVLYINKKSHPMLGFLSYGETKSQKPVEDNIENETVKEEPINKEPVSISPQQSPKEKQSPERIVFIILDGVSNSKSGIRNARKLARKLVNSGSPGDAFIILKATVSMGLEYLIGPEKDKDKLLAVIDKLYLDPSWVLLVPSRSVGNGSIFDHYTADKVGKGLVNEMPGKLRQMSAREIDNISGEYRVAVTRFAKSLENLKYALKTIRLPKTVFIVTGAIQDISGDLNFYMQDRLNIQYFYDSMRKATVAINKGGSMLFMINPIPEVYKTRKAVNIMSKISNAKCINASDVDSVMKKVKNSTAAYYEVAFAVTPQLGESFRIKVKCKRKGIRLNTLEFGEKTITYSQMEDIQKELFALNVITGGSWSRMAGKVMKNNCSVVEEFQKKGKTIKKVKLQIPQRLLQKQVDVFAVNLEQGSLKADFKKENRLIGNQDYINLDVDLINGREQYVVVIEPETMQCIFTQVL